MMRPKLHPAVMLGWVLFLVAATMFILQHYRASHQAIFSKQPLTATEEADYEKTTGMAPEQMARKLFEACGKEDWNEVLKFMPPELLNKDPKFLDRFKTRNGGLQLVSLGAPFKGVADGSGTNETYPGVFVPYEIRLKGGQKIQWQLAIRCDNPAHQWYWDGGL